MPESLWRVRHSVTRPLSGFPRPGTIASDRVWDSNYHFEGQRRPKIGHCVFQYTLSGRGVFRHGHAEFALPPGTGFLCRIADPETAYYYPQDASEPWVHVFFAFLQAESLVDELVNRFGYVYRVPMDTPFIARLIGYERYSESTMELLPGDGARLVMELLSTLADIGAEQTSSSPHAWLVSRARRAIDTHLERSYNVGELATDLGVSREHLCRVFKRETGSTALSYMARQKARRACDLLRDTALSCKEIADRLGYDSSSHFARSFRRVVGTTPRAYRRFGAIAPL